MSARIAPPRMTARDGGVEDGIIWATCNAPIYGAVNGYVRVPEGHPWRGLDYDDPRIDVDVNGGLTFSRDGWIGYDTLHFGDLWPGQESITHFCRPGTCDCTRWTPEMVAEETRRLARQVAEAGR